MKSSALAAVAALALASLVIGCATQFPHGRVANRCDITGPGTLAVSVSLVELAPGEKARLPRPMLFTSPHAAPDTLPSACNVRWSAGSGGTITAGGELTIARDAAPGSTVVVRAQVDTLVAEQQIHVVDPAPSPLAGTWTQDTPPMCESGARPADAIVRELVFRRGGTFTVTRVPFESYRDYWGTYTFDAAAARLTLTATGGNSAAGFTAAELTARVVDGRLNLDGVLLAPAPGGGSGESCRSVFRRTGDGQGGRKTTTSPG